MKFILHYRGELKPNGSREHKHQIRKCFHPQLKKLWAEPPLNAFPELLRAETDGGVGLIRDLGPFKFASLVSSKISLLAELKITLLRPEAPGSIVEHNGDIDNRLKTLLDAMAVPSQAQGLPPSIEPAEGENPFFCVLDDDRLITKLEIHTERLLETTGSPFEVELLVLVKTRKVANEFNIMGPEDI